MIGKVETLLNLLKKSVRRTLGLNKNEHANYCFGQEGEDLILLRIFPAEYKGFYIDIGAHHPQRFSNTYLLYRRGWKGINIDATPGCMDLFNTVRPNDTNLEIGISNVDEMREFHIFEESALNTFNAKVAEENIHYGCSRKNTIMIKTQRLSSILAHYLPPTTTIDLLTIDVEGLDHVVLQSLDFTKYRPRVIVCELLSNDLEMAMKSTTALILTENGYQLYSKLYHSCIWVRKDMVL